jgi:DNA-binding MarR family transcriptional regulator
VSYAVANLKRLGLAAVQVDPADQRRSRISATAAGIARLRTVTAAVRQAPAVEAPPPGPVTHAALVAA